MAIQGGQRILASELNLALPILARATADVTRTSSTTLTDATGLAIALEADALYALEGYLAYNAGETGDLKVAFTVPAGATGHWGLYPIATASTGSIGDLDARRQAAFGAATTQAAGGSAAFSSELMCPVFGYIDTAATAGTLQLQFAQNTSSGTGTTLKAGSWLMAFRLE
ncbi:MAG: hypothetical protein V4515_04520 [Chloroflexota bacterium]